MGSIPAARLALRLQGPARDLPLTPIGEPLPFGRNSSRAVAELARFLNGCPWRASEIQWRFSFPAFCSSAFSLLFSPVGLTACAADPVKGSIGCGKPQTSPCLRRPGPGGSAGPAAARCQVSLDG